MKKTLATVAIAFFGALVATGLVSPAQAQATQLGFVQDLNNHGLIVYDTSTTLKWGYAICEQLNTHNGVQVAEAFYRVTNNDVPDRYTAFVWVESAVENLCPWHDHR